MELKRLREDVIAALNEMDTPYEVEIRTTDIIKMNDLHLCGIVFQKGNVGKTFYLNAFAAEDVSATEIAEEMLAACEVSVDAPPFDEMDWFSPGQPISEISDHLHVALIGDDRNGEYLQQVVSKSITGGLSFICQVRFRSDCNHEILSTTITKDLAEANQWDTKELFRLAISNTKESDPAALYAMEDALANDKKDLLASDGEIPEGMLILSNKSGVFGAAALFLPGVIDRIHEKLGEGFYAIPSSVHEFLIIPESSGMTISSLNAACREINETGVRHSDVLSDSVLHMPYEG